MQLGPPTPQPSTFTLLSSCLLSIKLIEGKEASTMDTWMNGWTGGSIPPQRRAGQVMWPGLMRGAPHFGGFLSLFHSHCGHGCLSLLSRYQRAFWEVMPQGPPCLILSNHTLAFFSFPCPCFFIPPLFVSFLCLICLCIVVYFPHRL